MNNNNTYHIPILQNLSIEKLITNKKRIYVDATFGGGGHSKEILKNLDLKGQLLAFDKDIDAQNQADKIKNINFKFIKSDFKDLKKQLLKENINSVDGILVDLGISSHQIDESKRGFSTRFDYQLDMRMDQNQELTAKEILNHYNQENIIRIFKDYGEFKNAYHLAKAIISYRLIRKINTTFDLKESLKDYAFKGRENKFYARIFQALRIEVNKELESLKQLLIDSKDILNKDGRIVVISYHSLEDRLVKRFFKTGNFEGIINKDQFGNIIRPFKPLQSKVIIPTEDEIKNNNRARSAKMRVGIKV
ncbi:MAG: 16S rRNA (cytosine(1402)-N(4))-methyltransferase RsmH [Bacteroidetes bacterium]|nr:16S rRNA (cytosine(1402)-N(4))-methyltransferase RsmH [Bacteroidota bacterium]